MPKVLQINTVVNYASTGKIAEDIGRQALKQGWESYIAFGRKPRNSSSVLIKIGNSWDVLWHGLLSRFFDKQGFGSRWATKKLVRKIEQLAPDIIHLHNLHGYYLNIAVLFGYLKRKNIPVIWTLHDCWPVTGHCAYYLHADCIKWKTECHACPQTNSYPKSFYDNSRANYRQKKQIFTGVKNLTLVAVSKWLAEDVSQSFLKEYGIKQIYNGIDTAIFSPKKNTAKISDRLKIENRFILLGVAFEWNLRKGFDDFIRLSKMLAPDEILILVGVSKAQLKSLPANIIGIEKTENIEDLASLYSTSHVFLNLTKEDNFPTTNIEAMACGTPVITYNTGGSGEAVADGTGWVVDKGDLHKVYEIISENKPSLLNRMLEARCRERALINFDKTNKYVEYIELYLNVLKQ